MPADFCHQIADRAFAWRDRSAGGHLLYAHDAEWLHLRECQYREPRSCLRRYADRARTQGQCEAWLRAIELLRVRWHECIGCLQTARCMTVLRKAPGATLRPAPSSDCRLSAINGISARLAIRRGASHEQAFLLFRSSLHTKQADCHGR